jgi:hypothetical protein
VVGSRVIAGVVWSGIRIRSSADGWRLSHLRHASDSMRRQLIDARHLQQLSADTAPQLGPQPPRRGRRRHHRRRPMPRQHPAPARPGPTRDLLTTRCNLTPEPTASPSGRADKGPARTKTRDDAGAVRVGTRTHATDGEQDPPRLVGPRDRPEYTEPQRSGEEVDPDGADIRYQLLTAPRHRRGSRVACPSSPRGSRAAVVLGWTC